MPNLTLNLISLPLFPFLSQGDCKVMSPIAYTHFLLFITPSLPLLFLFLTPPHHIYWTGGNNLKCRQQIIFSIPIST